MNANTNEKPQICTQICTYGHVVTGPEFGGGYPDPYWCEQRSQAFASAQRAYEHASEHGFRYCGGVGTMHGATLARARNQAIRHAIHLGYDFLVLLDADDRLSENYITELLSAPDADIKRPSVQVGDEAPRMLPLHPIMRTNSFVIGCAIRPTLALACGGFREFDCLEDWAFFAAYLERGAHVVDVPEAIYHAQQREGSRNANADAYAQTIREFIRGTTQPAYRTEAPAQSR